MHTYDLMFGLELLSQCKNKVPLTFRFSVINFFTWRKICFNSWTGESFPIENSWKKNCENKKYPYSWRTAKVTSLVTWRDTTDSCQLLTPPNQCAKHPLHPKVIITIVSAQHSIFSHPTQKVIAVMSHCHRRSSSLCLARRP